jgi:16S rRNA (uracil1498-N3)-methyltransferase
MAVRDLASQRLFVTTDLATGMSAAASEDQARYLRSVLRLDDGTEVLVFNGRDGEWRATVRHHGKRGVILTIGAQTRPQTRGPDVHYLFAPLKRARLDYMVQKATEMGAALIRPVITRRTIAERVNVERMRANVIEAAEQCGVLRVPEVAGPEPLDRVIDHWDSGRRLIFCDEAAPIADPLRALATVPRGAPVAILIGPEGGFSDDERRMLLAKPFILAISIGPRIMRADTAAVAALALVNAVAGDWA